MEGQGVKLDVDGFPSYEEYQEARDMITDYTDGHLLVTSWRWNVGAVTPGESAGLCIGDPDNTSNYWSCWEFFMEESGDYQDAAKSYLVNPADYTATSRLNQFADIGMSQFPAMYGSWLCLPPMTYDNGTYSNCLRFLPNDSYSNTEDFKFKQGPVNVMTYLTSRADATELANGNDTMTTENPMLESFVINLSGAFSGISAAAFAVASAAALLSF